MYYINMTLNAFVMDEFFFFWVVDRFIVVMHCIYIHFIFAKYPDNQKPISIPYIKYLNFKCFKYLKIILGIERDFMNRIVNDI